MFYILFCHHSDFNIPHVINLPAVALFALGESFNCSNSLSYGVTHSSLYIHHHYVSTCFMQNSRIHGENCSIFNCLSSGAAPVISLFRIPTMDDDKSKLEEQHCCSHYSCVDGGLKRQIKNQTLHTCRLFLLTKTFQYTGNFSKASWSFTHPLI